MLQLTYGYRTDIGAYRSSNQDYTEFGVNQSGQYLAIVCDGMGGHEHGDVASRLATTSLMDKFKRVDFRMFDDRQINAWFRDAIYQIQSEMIEYAAMNPGFSDMGTTLVAALIANKKVYAVNVGDSRLYKLHNNKMYQITVDQNIYNSTSVEERMELAVSGIYQKRYNENTFWKVLTSALGPTKTMKIDTYVIDDIVGTYILTTDGIHDYVDEYDFHDALLSNKKTKIRFAC